MCFFFFWDSYNGQTCFPLLDADISELLTTAPVHADKHILPERKVIMCATFVVYVMSIESWDRKNAEAWFLPLEEGLKAQ